MKKTKLSSKPSQVVVCAVDMKSKERIAETFPVIHHLRPHLIKKEYVGLVQKMAKQGFLQAVVKADGVITSVAGYRFSQNLPWGKFLYVDDLVTDPDCRSKGHGKLLLNWLIQEAKKKHCDQFHLDSGSHRVDAHRFYLRERLSITGFHFAKKLD